MKMERLYFNLLPMDQFDICRIMAWDMYASSILGMSLHPGTTRDEAKPKTMKEICNLADEMLAERDGRFNASGDRHRIQCTYGVDSR